MTRCLSDRGSELQVCHLTGSMPLSVESEDGTNSSSKLITMPALAQEMVPVLQIVFSATVPQ